MKKQTNNNNKKYLMWIVYAIMLIVTVMSASAEVTQEDLLNGMVSYWDGSYLSTTAYDVHGVNDGTANNARVLGQTGSDKIPDYGFDFTQGDDYVTVPDDSSLDLTTAITVSQQVYVDSYGGVFLAKRDGDNYPYEISMGSSGLVYFGINSNTNRVDTGSFELNLNQWYHVVGTYDKSNIKIYIDGEEKGSFVYTGDINTNTVPFTIGKRSYVGQEAYFNGLLDEVIIFDRALNSTEVSTLYDIQKDGLESGSYDFSGAFESNFSVSGFDSWSDDALSSINVSVDGTVYSNESGNTVVTDILSNSTSLHNVTVSSPGYFDANYYNYNVSTGTLSSYLNQSEIRFDAYEFLSEDEVTSFNVTINDTTKNESESWGLSVGEYNATFSSADYLNKTIEFNVSALDNKTVSFYNITGSILNIDVVDAWNNTSINNFSGWYSAPAFGFNETFNTSDGLVSLNLKRNVNYTVFVENEDYAIVDDNYKEVYLNESEENITFSLYKTNSLDISFREDNTKDLIDQLVTLELISDDYSYNYTTSNGTLQIEFVVPSTYIFRYRSEGYDEGFYRIAVGDRSYNDLDLYMINSTASSAVTLTVIDESASPVEGYVVKSLKYDQENNSYIIQEIKETDFLGEAIFNVRKNEEYYRFIIEKDGVMVRMTNPSYITADSLTIQVITTDLIAGEYFNVLGITSSVTYNNVTGNFRAEYNDESALGSIYCLKVTKIGRTIELIGLECSTSASGVLLFNQPFEENSIYQGELYLNVDPIQSLGIHIEDWTVPFNAGEMGLIIQILLTIFFAMTFMYNPSMGAIMTPMSILLGRIIGLNSLPWIYITPVIIIGIIIVYLMER